MSNKRLTSGFTLIEILVAAVILFLMTTTGLLAYKSALQTNQRVAARYEMLRPVTMLVDHIREQMRTSEKRSGSGQIDEVSYHWDSELLKKLPPPARFDPDEMRFVQYSPRYELHNVTIQLEYGQFQHSVSYKEVTWQNDLTVSQDSP